MSVEYALMLVLIMGVLTTGIGLALQSEASGFRHVPRGRADRGRLTGSDPSVAAEHIR